jgi:hypothetical protein
VLFGQVLADSCTNLVYLDLTRAEKLRDESLKAIGRSCPNLKYINLYVSSVCSSWNGTL